MQLNGRHRCGLTAYSCSRMEDTGVVRQDTLAVGQDTLWSGIAVIN